MNSSEYNASLIKGVLTGHSVYLSPGQGPPGRKCVPTHFGSCPGSKHAIINLLHRCPTTSTLRRAMTASSWMLLAITHQATQDLFPNHRTLRNYYRYPPYPTQILFQMLETPILIIVSSCKRGGYFLGPLVSMKYNHQILSFQREAVSFTIIYAWCLE